MDFCPGVNLVKRVRYCLAQTAGFLAPRKDFSSGLLFLCIRLGGKRPNVEDSKALSVLCVKSLEAQSTPRPRFWLRQLGCAVLKFGALTLAALSLTDPLLSAQVKPAPFQPGERLTYDVTWSIFQAGTVSATLQNVGQVSKDEYAVITTAQSQGFVSLLFDVHNEFRSFFDPRTLCSQRISKKINEGRRHKETEIVFDSQRSLAILDERDLAKPQDPPKHAENAIPHCVEDVVTAFYYLRRQDLQIGKPLHLPVNDGSKTYDVTLYVQARETIQTPLGNRSAIRVEPKVFSGLFKRKGRMLVWFSDDDQLLPLRIKFMIAVGPITATLKSVTHVAEKSPPQGQPWVGAK